MEKQTEQEKIGKAEVKHVRRTEESRLCEIVKVLMKYNVLIHLAEQTHPENIREAFEELGPTFIKIGQILSVRTDIVSEEFAQEFKKLQDGVKSNDFTVIGPSIEQEAGVPLKDLFQSIEEKPLASASIGQVHSAVLINGTPVVVKVQHPGIYEEMCLDISLMEKAVPLIKHAPVTGMTDPAAVIGELKNSLLNELDFTKEADNIDRFHKLNKDIPYILSPRVYREYSTSRLLIMDFMQGMKVSDFVSEANDKIEKGNNELKEVKSRLAKEIVDNYMKQIFDDGYFHADPHPGNLLITTSVCLTGKLPPSDNNELDSDDIKASAPTDNSNLFAFDVLIEGQSIGSCFQKLDLMDLLGDTQAPDIYEGNEKVVYIDFGMMGTLDESTIEKFNRVMAALTQQDSAQIARSLLGLCKVQGHMDMDRFTSDVDGLFRQYYDMPIGDMSLPVIFEDMTRLCTQYHLQLPQNITLLAKGIGTIEGIVLSLDPNLSIMTAVTPYAKRYLRQQFDPKAEVQGILKDFYSGLKSVPKLPGKIMNVLETFSRGEMKVSMEHKNLDDLFQRLEVMVNRLVMGLIISALIVGSSMLINSATGSLKVVVSTLGVLGFTLALILAGVMIFKTYRNRKNK